MGNSNNPIKNKRRPPEVKETLRAALAEFVSTFLFVFAGSGSRIAVKNLTGDAVSGLIAVAVAHGFALSAAVNVASIVSGDPYKSRGHVNPAVTFGAFIGGNIHVVRCVIYWIAQLLGSIVACVVLMLVTGGQRAPVFGLAGGVGVGNAVVLEMVMTFGLVYTVYATTVDPKATSTVDPNAMTKAGLDQIAPLAIGLIVGANILVGGAFDGASMNPTLSFGPALVNWSWGNHWVYWVGPLIGGGLAGFTYDFSFINN